MPCGDDIRQDTIETNAGYSNSFIVWPEYLCLCEISMRRGRSIVESCTNNRAMNSVALILGRFIEMNTTLLCRNLRTYRKQSIKQLIVVSKILNGILLKYIVKEGSIDGFKKCIEEEELRTEKNLL